MISTRAQPARRTPHYPGHDEGSSGVGQDLAGLIATLRELALRTHRVVRAADAAGSHPGVAVGLTANSVQELTALHARIVQLQRAFHAQALNDLAAYVAALRLKVEDHL
jgi:hypothetical protein